MPFYEYACAACGVFSNLRPMAQYQDPQPCPECRELSPRIVATSPSFTAVPLAARRAHAVNERSAHAPKGITRLSRGEKRSDGGRASTPVKRAHGGRPWMLGH